MNEVIQFLNDNPVQYLATIGLDGKPKARPFQFMLEDGGKLWFCTSSQKDVYQEIQRQPYVEVTASSPKFAWIRLSGKATFENNMGVKNKIIADSGLVRSIYKTGNNPIFAVFYLAEAQAIIADFSGQPPKAYEL